jgi:hypothetical protein
MDRAATFLLYLWQEQIPRNTHSQLRQALQGLLRSIRVNSGKRSTMTSVERVQEHARFPTTHFANNNSVGPVPKRCFE